VNLTRIVPGSREVAPHHAFEPLTLNVRPGKRPVIEQHFAKVVAQYISVPDPIMVQLVPTKKEPLKMEMRERMIYQCDPLGHTIVVSIFGLESELQQIPGGPTGDSRWATRETAVCRN